MGDTTLVGGLKLDIGGSPVSFETQFTDAAAFDKFQATLEIGLGSSSSHKDTMLTTGVTIQEPYPTPNDGFSDLGLFPVEARASAGLSFNFGTGDILPAAQLTAENISLPGFGADLYVSPKSVALSPYDFDVPNENNEIVSSPAHVQFDFTPDTNMSFINALAAENHRGRPVPDFSIDTAGYMDEVGKEAPFSVIYLNEQGDKSHTLAIPDL